MKKSLIRITVILSMLLLTLIPLSVNAAIVGDGTEASPFMITNETELELVTDYPKSHFKLANDIVMTKNIVPLCFYSENQKFEGVFDGNGHTISDLLISNDIEDMYGNALFYENNGIIKNLNIANATIDCNYESYRPNDEAWGNSICTSGITYSNYGSITNCTVSGNIGGIDEWGGIPSGIANHNSGLIANCRVSGNIGNEYHSSTVGGIAHGNSGTISKCSVSAKLVGSSCAGIAQSNSRGVIEDCEFTGTTDSSSMFGGITNRNGEYGVISRCKVIGDFQTEKSGNCWAGGISFENQGTIKDCYFIGSLDSNRVGGISPYNLNAISNCYVVATLNYTDENEVHIIGSVWNNCTISNCFYDRTVSGINDRTQGTPLSTAGMKLKQSYQGAFDFDTVWGIDENINDGYPYLLWEYPNVEAKNPYTVNDVKIKDLSGNELEEIPDSSFYFEINVTKNDNSKNDDSLIIAVYDEKGAFMDLKYMSGTYYQNQTMSFGSMINKTDKKIGKIKAFVWDSISGMHPLSNAMEVKN